jgi:sugar phosphate isomerase/epimerase
VKLAYMMTTPEAAPLALCWHGEPAYVIGRIAEIGYAGVELQVQDPAKFDHAAIATLANDNGIAISAVSTGAIGAAENLYLTLPDAAGRRKAIDRFRAVLELAAEYGVDASIGRFRGGSKIAGSREHALTWLREALEELLPLAESLGNKIVLEPQTRYIGDLLNTIDETVTFIRTFDTISLTFEADFHHQSLEEHSLVASLVAGQRSGLMSYVQIADSTRHAPGTGSFNWIDLMATLHASGYDGWLAMEFTQGRDSDRAAQLAYRTVRGALDTIQA